MTSIMLHIEHMNATITLRLAAQSTIRFIAWAFLGLAFAGGEVALASSALLPSEAGEKGVSPRTDPVKLLFRWVEPAMGVSWAEDAVEQR